MKLHGLIAATPTPMHEDGSIRPDLIAPMMEWMMERGVSGFHVCGSTGEGPSLTDDERRTVAEASVAAVAGRKPVAVQVGADCLRTACDLARHAAETGADAISVSPPFHFRPETVEPLIDSIAVIAGAAPDLPFYYDHDPRLSGVDLDMVVFLERGRDRIPNLAGIHFRDPDLAEFRNCQEVDNQRFNLLFGSEEMMLGAFAMGANAAVGSSYGFAAPLWRRIIESFDRQDLYGALAHQTSATGMVRFLGENPASFQAMVKQVVWPSLGFEVGALRSPQMSLGASQLTEAKAAWEASEFPALIG